MLRNVAYTLTLVFVLGGFVYAATLHLVEADARVSAAERDLLALRGDLDELRARVDAPLAPPPRPGTPDPSTVYAVPVADAPSRGPTDAPVTIVAFTDYQCPFCQRVEGTLAALRERFPDDVRVVVQHLPLPFHQQAFDAAVAAECAGEQDLFWPMHDALFANQRALSEQRRPAAFAHELSGLDRTAFDRCIAADHARTRVAEDMRLAERFGARGTPSFFINGKLLVGAQPLEKFAESVEAARATAHASDIPAAHYYRRAVLEKGALGLARE